MLFIICILVRLVSASTFNSLLKAWIDFSSAYIFGLLNQQNYIIFLFHLWYFGFCLTWEQSNNWPRKKSFTPYYILHCFPDSFHQFALAFCACLAYCWPCFDILPVYRFQISILKYLKIIMDLTSLGLITRYLVNSCTTSMEDLGHYWWSLSLIWWLLLRRGT